MIVPFVDSVTGTRVYLNPDYVVAVRPDPGNPTGVSVVKLRDGESIRVEGDHEAVVERLSGTA